MLSYNGYNVLQAIQKGDEKMFKEEYEGFDERPDIITNEEDWI